MNEKKDPLDDDLLRELGLEPREGQVTNTPSSLPESEDENPDDDFFYGEAPVTPKAVKGPAKRPAERPMEAPAKPTVEPVAPKPSAQAEFEQGLARMSMDLPLQVVAVLGKKTMSLKEVLNLKQGEIIELKKMPQDLVDLVANGKLIGRGELVLVDGKLGIQIKQISRS